jgi:hypothetical protein
VDFDEFWKNNKSLEPLTKNIALFNKYKRFHVLVFYLRVKVKCVIVGFLVMGEDKLYNPIIHDVILNLVGVCERGNVA